MFSGGQFGASVSLTKYMKRAGYGFLSLNYERHNIPYRTSRVSISDALLHVEYMEPVLSDRRKNVMLYAGISALGGYEQVNEDRRLLPDGATLLDNSKWIYGGALHIRWNASSATIFYCCSSCGQTCFSGPICTC